jgi:hypothetical protein
MTMLIFSTTYFFDFYVSSYWPDISEELSVPPAVNILLEPEALTSLGIS